MGNIADSIFFVCTVPFLSIIKPLVKYRSGCNLLLYEPMVLLPYSRPRPAIPNRFLFLYFSSSLTPFLSKLYQNCYIILFIYGQALKIHLNVLLKNWFKLHSFAKCFHLLVYKIGISFLRFEIGTGSAFQIKRFWKLCYWCTKKFPCDML